MQSSVMCGVRVNMMERRPLVAVGQKTTNQIRDRLCLCSVLFKLLKLSSEEQREVFYFFSQ